MKKERYVPMPPPWPVFCPECGCLHNTYSHQERGRKVLCCHCAQLPTVIPRGESELFVSGCGIPRSK